MTLAINKYEFILNLTCQKLYEGKVGDILCF